MQSLRLQRLRGTFILRLYCVGHPTMHTRTYNTIRVIRVSRETKIRELRVSRFSSLVIRYKYVYRYWSVADIFVSTARVNVILTINAGIVCDINMRSKLCISPHVFCVTRKNFFFPQNKHGKSISIISDTPRDFLWFILRHGQCGFSYRLECLYNRFGTQRKSVPRGRYLRVKMDFSVYTDLFTSSVFD